MSNCGKEQLGTPAGKTEPIDDFFQRSAGGLTPTRFELRRLAPCYGRTSAGLPGPSEPPFGAWQRYARGALALRSVPRSIRRSSPQPPQRRRALPTDELFGISVACAVKWSRRRRTTATFLAAFRHDRINVRLVLDAPTNDESIVAYVAQFQLHTLSPDLNLIKQVFARLKTLRRKANTRSVEATWQQIGSLIDAFPL